MKDFLFIYFSLGLVFTLTYIYLNKLEFRQLKPVEREINFWVFLITYPYVFIRLITNLIIKELLK